MEPINIGIDLDGVLANYALAYSQVLRELYGELGRPLIHDHSKVKSWQWSKWYPVTKERDDFAYKVHIPSLINFWETLPLIENIGWHEFKHEARNANLYFITARIETKGSTVVRQSQNWLHDIAHIKFPNVICARDKGPIAAALQLRMFIDDKPENCLEVKAASPRTTVYMIDYPYNAHIDDPQIVRTSTFDTLTKDLASL